MAQRVVVVGAVGERELDAARVEQVAEDHALQRKGSDRRGDDRDAEARGDQRQQDRGARGLVLAARHEAGLAAAAQDGLVDRRVTGAVGDERLGAQIGQAGKNIVFGAIILALVLLYARQTRPTD